MSLIEILERFEKPIFTVVYIFAVVVLVLDMFVWRPY
jgi:hypothetical protein